MAVVFVVDFPEQVIFRRREVVNQLSLEFLDPVIWHIIPHNRREHRNIPLSVGPVLPSTVLAYIPG